MKPIHIFRAGRHTASNGATVTFSERDLSHTATVYDPVRHEAPIVVGHPKGDAPAYGWVAGLEARPDGLFALPRQVNPDFAEIVAAGAYKKVSASFYAPDAPQNPTPGAYYLRHVGFLGAQAPAVKGLQAIELAAPDIGIIDFDDGAHELMQHRLHYMERQNHRRKAENAIDRAIAEGRVVPRFREALLQFHDALSEDPVLDFAEDDTTFGKPMPKSPSDFLLTYLSRCPTFITPGEIVKPEDDPWLDHDEGAGFSAPDGYAVDPGGAALHRRALDYQREHGVDYAQAVLAVVSGPR